MTRPIIPNRPICGLDRFAVDPRQVDAGRYVPVEKPQKWTGESPKWLSADHGLIVVDGASGSRFVLHPLGQCQ